MSRPSPLPLFVVLSSLVLALSACGDPAVGDPDAGNTVNPQSVTFCDVKAVLDAKCSSCHGASPVSGAPQLTTRAQLLANSPAGGSMLDRSIYLMGFTPVSGAMPPNLGSSADEIAVFEAWKKNGTPNCAVTATDAGTPMDAGVVTPVCTSGQTWNFGTSGRTEMNPGEACQSCHQSRGRGPLDGFMGTVYPTLHELPLCMDTSVPAGLSVEILDMAGTVRLTLFPTSSNNGNFRGGSFGTPSPYRARVKINGVVTSEMLTLQTNGDCNICHTSAGAQNAPGRIHW